MARKKRRPVEEPMTRFGLLVGVIIGLELIALFWITGGFRILGAG